MGLPDPQSFSSLSSSPEVQEPKLPQMLEDANLLDHTALHTLPGALSEPSVDMAVLVYDSSLAPSETPEDPHRGF